MREKVFSYSCTVFCACKVVNFKFCCRCQNIEWNDSTRIDPVAYLQSIQYLLIIRWPTGHQNLVERESFAPNPGRRDPSLQNLLTQPIGWVTRSPNVSILPFWFHLDPHHLLFPLTGWAPTWSSPVPTPLQVPFPFQWWPPLRDIKYTSSESGRL